MRNSQGFNGVALVGAIIGAGLVAAAGAAVYTAAHMWPVARTAASALLATASGAAWIVSAALPARFRRTAARLNVVAATLTALSGACLLP